MGGWVWLVAVGLGLIPALIAKSKGRSFALWWAFGTFLFLIALVAALVIEEQKPCPSCGAPARVSSVFCPTCGKQLPRRARAALGPESTLGMTPMQRDELLRQARRKTNG